MKHSKLNKKQDEPGWILIDIGIGLLGAIGIIGGLWFLFYWVFILATIINGDVPTL